MSIHSAFSKSSGARKTQEETRATKRWTKGFRSIFFQSYRGKVLLIYVVTMKEWQRMPSTLPSMSMRTASTSAFMSSVMLSGDVSEYTVHHLKLAGHAYPKIG